MTSLHAMITRSARDQYEGALVDRRRKNRWCSLANGNPGNDGCRVPRWGMHPSPSSPLAIRAIQSVSDAKKRKFAAKCETCKGSDFYPCKLCRGKSSIEWSPLCDPVVIKPCLCPTCEGNKGAKMSQLSWQGSCLKMMWFGVPGREIKVPTDLVGTTCGRYEIEGNAMTYGHRF